MAERPLLECRDLRAGYGRMQVLHGVTLTVHHREVVAVIGANGAGKTTLMRTVMGFLHPSAGVIRYRDRDVSRMSPHRMARLRVAYVPEGRELFAGLSVADNLRLGRTAAGPNSMTDSAVLDLFPVLAQRRDQRAGTLSGGEQQMVAMARALIAKPDLCLMDEPSLGLAPMAQEQVFQIIGAFQAAGASVLLVEQNARRALELCDRGYVLESGRTTVTGNGHELATSPMIERAYLGKAPAAGSDEGPG